MINISGFQLKGCCYFVLLQVQQEILQKRREEKKATLEAVKKYRGRGGRGERPSFLGRGAEEEPVATEGPSVEKGGKKRIVAKSMKRIVKVAKQLLLFLTACFGIQPRWYFY